MITAIIPVKDALIQFRQMYQSLVHNSSLVREVIVVNDQSGEDTTRYINSLDVRILNAKEHLWTNRAWNLGVKNATEEFIAVLNSDIILPRGWDKQMVSEFEGDIVSPYNPSVFHQEYFPGMINGSSFMFRDKNLFPIKGPLHWFGDNILSKNKVKFIDVDIAHSPESSSRLLDPKEYWNRIYLDTQIYLTMDDCEGTQKILKMVEKKLTSLQ